MIVKLAHVFKVGVRSPGSVAVVAQIPSLAGCLAARRPKVPVANFLYVQEPGDFVVGAFDQVGYFGGWGVR